MTFLRELIFCVAALALFGSILNTLPAPTKFHTASIGVAK
jgi:hypothetical protein